MARRSGSENRRLSKQVFVRLDPEHHARLVAEATSAGLTLAALVRRRVVGQPVRARIDTQSISQLNRLGALAKIGMRSGDPNSRQSAQEAWIAIAGMISLLSRWLR